MKKIVVSNGYENGIGLSLNPFGANHQNLKELMNATFWITEEAAIELRDELNRRYPDDRRKD